MLLASDVETSRLAGLSVIPAIVRELSDLQTMEQALIGIQRRQIHGRSNRNG